jgi:DNA repair exonuclease SbcCD nuclease subunit
VPFRFVHTADIHLDSPLRSLALRDPALAELVGDASRRAFTGIIDLCLAEAVDALLIAGDLYDGEQTSMKTALFLAGQLRRLHEAGIPAFIIRGNHDALSRVTRELTLPDTVKLFGGRAEAVALERAPGELPVIIHGLSFARSHAPDGLLPQYRAPQAGAINIGMMHTSLDGAPGHDPYAPCAAADLLASGFDYWALGHIHRRAVIEGACTVVMPGMPQGRDIGEAGPKSVSLVRIEDDRTVHVAQHPTGIAQFERAAVDLSGIDDWRDLLHAAAAALRALRASVAAEHLIVRLALAGATPLAWRLRRDADQVQAELNAIAAELPGCWIDSVETALVSLPALAEQPGADGSAVAELQRLIGSDILPAASYQRALAEIADELRGQLPPECRHLLGTDAEQARRALAALARDGVQDVLARLQAVPDREAP